MRSRQLSLVFVVVLCGLGVAVPAGATAVLLNPSFEDGPAFPPPGLGDIPDWDQSSNIVFGGDPLLSGTNPDSGGGSPLADNGLIPDGNRVAFINAYGPSGDNVQSISQDIGGLEAGKTYTVGFRVNGRDWNDDPVLEVLIDGVLKLGPEVILPVGGANQYLGKAFVFTATGPTHTLTFQAGVQTASDDATLLLDSVSVVEGPIVVNPSFEEGPAFGYPGYGDIPGWDQSSNYAFGGDPPLSGTNPASDGSDPFVFADNGLTPDGDRVAFIEAYGPSGDGVQTISQDICGFLPGGTYKVSFLVNGRDWNDSPVLDVLIDDVVMLGPELITPVGGADPYLQRSFLFEATDVTHTLAFQASLPSGASDATVLLDYVTVRLVPEPGTLALLAVGGVGVLFSRVVRRRRRGRRSC